MQDAFGHRPLAAEAQAEGVGLHEAADSGTAFIDDPFAVDAIGHIGVDRVLWGSRLPRMSGRSASIAHDRLKGIFEGLPQGDQQKLVSGNVAALYGI